MCELLFSEKTRTSLQNTRETITRVQDSTFVCDYEPKDLDRPGFRTRRTANPGAGTQRIQVSWTPGPAWVGIPSCSYVQGHTHTHTHTHTHLVHTHTELTCLWIQDRGQRGNLWCQPVRRLKAFFGVRYFVPHSARITKSMQLCLKTICLPAATPSCKEVSQIPNSTVCETCLTFNQPCVGLHTSFQRIQGAV